MEGGHITIRLSVHLFKIHHRSFCEFRPCIQEVANLTDMVTEVIQEVHLHKVEIQFVDKMLGNFWLNPNCVFINEIKLHNGGQIVPSGVTHPYLQFVQSKKLFQGIRDLLCEFTCTESTQIILLTMKLLQMILHVLDHGFSMVPVLCHMVTIH